MRVTRSQTQNPSGEGVPVENADLKNASTRGKPANSKVSSPYRHTNKGRNTRKGSEKASSSPIDTSSRWKTGKEIPLERQPIRDGKDLAGNTSSESESVYSSRGSRESSPDSKKRDGERRIDDNFPQTQLERLSPRFDDSKTRVPNVTECDDARGAHEFRPSEFSRPYGQRFGKDTKTSGRPSNRNLISDEEEFAPGQGIRYSDFNSVTTSYSAHKAPPLITKRGNAVSSGLQSKPGQFSDDDEVGIHASPKTFNKTSCTDHKNSPVLTPVPSAKKTSQIIFVSLCIVPVICFIVACSLIFVLELKKMPMNGEIANVQDFQSRVGELRLAFPNQRETLWKISQHMLARHLNNSHPKEPAILLLTAATDAAETLLCLSKQLARAYAASRKGNYTTVLGALKKNDDSKDVKMSIDQTLVRDFQASSKAAVLHQLELLPPGSILILYKYCDHENAAYKDVAFIITVLLPDATLDPEMDLRKLEEKVRDFLEDTFIGRDPDNNASHGAMDKDKLSGVWSRISHAVLPVLPESNNHGICVEK